jgi:hypothetical protein
VTNVLLSVIGFTVVTQTMHTVKADRFPDIRLIFVSGCGPICSSELCLSACRVWANA